MIPSTQIAQSNGSARLNKRAVRALDKKYLYTTSAPKPLVQIQNNFTELFPMMPLTKKMLHETGAARALDKRHLLLNK